MAIQEQHSVPHGKLVAYKSYIYVIKIFKLVCTASDPTQQFPPILKIKCQTSYNEAEHLNHQATDITLYFKRYVHPLYSTMRKIKFETSVTREALQVAVLCYNL